MSGYTIESPVSELPSTSYDMADQELQVFARKLADYPPIKNIPTGTSFEAYLYQVMDVIGALLPFKYRGKKGTSEVVLQAGMLRLAEEFPAYPRTLYLEEHDCKLMAAVLAYFMRLLAQERKWPFMSEMVSFLASPHAYTAIFTHLPSEQEVLLPFSDADHVFIADFNERNSSGIVPLITLYPEIDFQGFIEEKRIVSESDFRQGLRNYDDQFRKSVAREKKQAV